MVETATRDRRTERHQATRAEILEAAWQVARTQGVGALTLGEVARRVGVRPPSLYWYFSSKHAIYDAMFAEGNQQLLDRIAGHDWPADLHGLLRDSAHLWVGFSTEDLARYQLLFQRSVPDFEPSAESYALALQVLELMRDRFAAAGLTDPAHLDLWTALVAGIAAQQNANDPGGGRWMRLTDAAVDMYLDHVLGTPTRRQR